MNTTELVDWIDEDVEAYLCDGTGSHRPWIDLADLCSAIGFDAVRRRELRHVGLKPERVASCALYRLGWRRELTPGRYPGFQYRRPPGPTTPAPRPTLLSRLRYDLEQYLCFGEGRELREISLSALLRSVGLQHLDIELVKVRARFVLHSMGWTLCTSRDRSAYRRPAATTSTLPSGSHSSTHQDAGAPPVKPTKTARRVCQRSRGAAEKAGAVEVTAM